MKALADQTRFSIVTMLLLQDFCVGGLARTLDISEAAVSQHLKNLKDVGLVTGEKYGYFMHYKVDRNVLTALSGALSELVMVERSETGECQPKSRELCKLCGQGHDL
jgi:ArsR family transcriptional regulator